MSISVDLNKIGEPISDIIKRKLEEANLPSCIGNMSPPILLSEATFDKTILKKKADTPPENIMVENVLDVLANAAGFPVTKDFVLDVDGRIAIEQYKEETAQQYVEHLVKCTECRYTDLCNNLTYHYLENIKLDLLIKRSELANRR